MLRIEVELEELPPFLYGSSTLLASRMGTRWGAGI
jgi:hypothetical protein